MYLSKEYDPDFCIETLLGESVEPVRLVSADYLPSKVRKMESEERQAELASWRSFLLQIGLNPSPRVVVDSTGVNHECSPELAALIGSEDVSTRKRTIECLDRHWDRYSDRVSFSARVRNQYVPRYTSFIMSLRSMSAPTKRRRVFRLSESFYPSDEVHDVFGDSANYVDARLTSEGFLDACGTVHRADIAACITRLTQLKQGGRASVQTVQRLYRHLEQLFDKDPARVKQAFREHRLILTKGRSPEWRSQDEVAWTPHGEFLDSLYPPLQGAYGDYRGFFVKRLGVLPELSVSALVEALPSLSDFEQAAESRISDALRIYLRASRELSAKDGEPDSNEPDWLATFRSESVSLDHHGDMVGNDGFLYVDDQPVISASFRDQRGLSFLAVPHARLPQVQALLDAADVPRLSEHVKIELMDPGDGHQNVELTSKVRGRYQLIARLVYGYSHPAFERAREAGAWRTLSGLEIVDVPTLSINASLNGETAAAQRDVALFGSKVFVRLGAKGVVDRVAMEIRGLLNVPASLSDGISRILTERDHSDAEEFLEVKGVAQLPEDEAAKLVAVQEPDPPPDEEVAADQNAPESAGTSGAPEPQELLADQADDSEPARGIGVPGAAGDSTQDTTPVDRHVNSEKPEQRGDDTLEADGGTSNPSIGGAPRTRIALARRPHGTRRATRQTERKKKGGRLLSYADGPGDQSDAEEQVDGEQREDMRDEIGDAAVEFFLTNQASRWALLEKMPANNKGFDVRAVLHDGQEQFIEVKGQSGAWTESGVALTPSELLCAAQQLERYWLCVVEYAIDANRRRLHLVNNPFGSTNQFRFDSGWKTASISESALVLKPNAGVRINIDGEGVGKIISVRGQIPYKLHIRLDDGRQIFRIFNPAKMRLSGT